MSTNIHDIDKLRRIEDIGFYYEDGLKYSAKLSSISTRKPEGKSRANASTSSQVHSIEIKWKRLSTE